MPTRKQYKSEWDGARIVRLRNRLNYSQVELADAIGVTLVSLARWENDLGAPSRLGSLRLDDLEAKLNQRNTERGGKAS